MSEVLGRSTRNTVRSAVNATSKTTLPHSETTRYESEKRVALPERAFAFNKRVESHGNHGLGHRTGTSLKGRQLSIPVLPSPTVVVSTTGSTVTIVSTVTVSPPLELSLPIPSLFSSFTNILPFPSEPLPLRHSEAAFSTSITSTTETITTLTTSTVEVTESGSSISASTRTEANLSSAEAHNSFLDNKPAVEGVFSALGIILFLSIVAATIIWRRRRAKSRLGSIFPFMNRNDAPRCDGNHCVANQAFDILPQSTTSQREDKSLKTSASRSEKAHVFPL